MNTTNTMAETCASMYQVYMDIYWKKKEEGDEIGAAKALDGALFYLS